MRDCKLVALDMDGTVLSVDGAISAANRDWIRRTQAAGVTVTFATGRRFGNDAKRFAQELGFSAPLVTLNGGALWTPGGELLETHGFAPADVRSLIDWAAARRTGFDGYAYTADRLVKWAVVSEDPDAHPWIKFVLESEDAGALRTAWDSLREMGRFCVTNTSPRNIEVNPSGVSKASGLASVCAGLGIRPDQVLAMGDSTNDIEMLRFAGVGVAMGNADDVVKAAADFVTLHHEDDGVAHALRALLEGRL